MRALLFGFAVFALIATPVSGRAGDLRELVTMPPEIQESLLMNMQDHLVTLDTILSHVASERFGEAARVAEQRLRFVTTSPEGEASILSWFPTPMLQAREGLLTAAKRFSAAAHLAEQRPDYASLREINWALGDITAACTGCHAHFRVR
jgi:hypothetical protein